MKYLSFIICLIFLSCQKQDSNLPQPKVEIVDHLPPPIFGKPGKGNGQGQNPHQNPPPTPPPPSPTPGQNVALVVFGGYYMNSNQWGTFYAPPAAITLTQRGEILAYLAVQFGPYNIGFTTDVNAYNAADPLKRQKVIVMDTSIRGPGATGVAVMGSFSTGSGTEALVFSNNLFNNSKYIGDIISHELGHTIGLYHQSLYDANGQLISVYRPSVMMGSPYDVNHAPWIYGPTYAWNIFQNDTQILTAKLGLK